MPGVPRLNMIKACINDGPQGITLAPEHSCQYCVVLSCVTMNRIEVKATVPIAVQQVHTHTECT